MTIIRILWKKATLLSFREKEKPDKNNKLGPLEVRNIIRRKARTDYRKFLENKGFDDAMLKLISKSSIETEYCYKYMVIYLSS